MCVSMLGAGASVLGAGMNILGAIRGGNAQANALCYRAEVARMQAQFEEVNAQMLDRSAEIESQNATIAERAGERAIATGAARAEARSMRTAGRVAAIETGQAASNIDVNTGSAVDVRAGTRSLGR